jgi:hypothetical protein
VINVTSPAVIAGVTGLAGLAGHQGCRQPLQAL